MSGFFMDQDVIALLDERFVPLLVDKSTDAPFVDEDVYGLSNYTFGTAMLVVSPNGEVLLDTYAHVEELLREALAGDERLAGPPAERLGDRLAQARLHARRGELDAADQLLAELLDEGEARSPDVEVGAWRLRARLATRRREGPEALDALARAREVAGVSDDRAADPALAFELDLDEVPTLVGMGDGEQAVARLDVLLADTTEHPRLTEAIYMRGALARYVEDKDVAQEWLEKLVLDESLADDRWAWMAAATLTSTAWSMEIPGALGWPEIPDDHDALALVRPPVYEPLPAREAARAEQDALEHLLATQKDDGSWPYRTDFMRENDRPADDFQLAIAAICIQGLLPHRGDPRVDDALERAIAWVLPADDASAAADEPNYFMDYSVWSRPYLLWLLADLLDHQLVERERAETMAVRLCRELKDLQKPEGGWSYYLTGDIESASPAVLVSMSFTTAVNVLALVRAQEAGLAAPSDLLARGLDSLESARNENGLFEYMVGINADRSSWRSGSAGRGPLCNLALERGERGVDGALEESLDDFVEFRGAYEKETGKALMHTGPEAEGSHWLMFDYAYAAVAADSLPARAKRRFEKPLLEMLLRARTSDGAYVDNPLLGSVFGAGMALVAFDHLLDDDDT